MITAVLILLCGASLPLTEAAFPKKYGDATAATLPAGGSGPEEITVHGRAIYPRWYEAGDGEPGSAKLGYGESDEARLVFFLAGEKNMLVIFPGGETPGFFPNSGEVTLTATLQDGYLRAREISIQKDGKSAEYPHK